MCGAKEQSLQPVLGHVSSTRTCIRLIKSPKTTEFPDDDKERGEVACAGLFVVVVVRRAILLKHEIQIFDRLEENRIGRHGHMRSKVGQQSITPSGSSL